jgi:hypothetical protein
MIRILSVSANPVLVVDRYTGWFCILFEEIVPSRQNVEQLSIGITSVKREFKCFDNAMNSVILGVAENKKLLQEVTVFRLEEKIVK